MSPVREDQDTDDVLPVKDDQQFPVMVIIPLNFARCPLHAAHAWKSLKATFHLTVSLRGQCAMGKIQRNNYHHGSCGP